MLCSTLGLERNVGLKLAFHESNYYNLGEDKYNKMIYFYIYFSYECGSLFSLSGETLRVLEFEFDFHPISKPFELSPGDLFSAKEGQHAS